MTTDSNLFVSMFCISYNSMFCISYNTGKSALPDEARGCTASEGKCTIQS